jgi:hypothetical protein
MTDIHTTHEYAKWVESINASVARINHVIRTSGGNHFWDMKTFKEMVTVLNGPPVPAWPLELRRKAKENNHG